MPHMEEVSLHQAQVIFETDELVDAIYFPGSACISIVTLMADGKAVETATVGRESAVALLDAITGQPTRARHFAQVPGSATRVPAAAFNARMHESHDLLMLTLRHARAIGVQAEQGVACNATHDVHGRLARWLLMTEDRVGAPRFPLTQEYMAVMTGVQRSTVSVMAAALKKAGVIDYSRGSVTIRDRAGLVEHACECYGVVAHQFESLRHQTR